MLIASVLGDAWRLAASGVLMAAIVGVWWFILTRAGTGYLFESETERAVATAKAEREPHLTHPRFQSVERGTLIVIIAANVVMIAQMLTFLPYFATRFGWSR